MSVLVEECARKRVLCTRGAESTHYFTALCVLDQSSFTPPTHYNCTAYRVGRVNRRTYFGYEARAPRTRAARRCDHAASPRTPSAHLPARRLGLAPPQARAVLTSLPAGLCARLLERGHRALQARDLAAAACSPAADMPDATARGATRSRDARRGAPGARCPSARRVPAMVAGCERLWSARFVVFGLREESTSYSSLSTSSY